MTLRFFPFAMLALAMPTFGTAVDGAEPNAGSRPLTTDGITIDEAEFDEPLPTPRGPKIRRPDDAPPAPTVGRDLVESPNPYEATLPEDAPYYETWPAEKLPLRQRRPLANYWHNRPRQLPLERESWLNRPYAASFLFGGLFLADPIENGINGNSGILLGGRFSWDFDPYWGVESRMALAYPGITDETGTVEFAAAQAFMWDLNWLWYWTGDTRWRPFFSVGLGALDLKYEALVGNQQNTSFTMPLGIGLKYRYSTRLAMRVDLTDNFSFENGIQNAMHNFSLTAGFEARFGGGMRRNYWPWNPGRDWR